MWLTSSIIYDKRNSTLYNAVTLQSIFFCQGEIPYRLDKLPFWRNIATAFQRLIACVQRGTWDLNSGLSKQHCSMAIIHLNIDYTQIWWVVNTRVRLVKTFLRFNKLKLTHRKMFWSFLTHLARNIWRTFCPHILASDWSAFTLPYPHWPSPENWD